MTRPGEYDDGLSSAVFEKEQDCPKCGSDNLVVYMDGHTHCFTQGCGYHTPATGAEASSNNKTPPKVKPKVSADLVPLDRISPATKNYRGLKPDTLSRFEYGRTVFGKEKAAADVWPIYAQDGSLWGQRLRYIEHKDFTVLQQGDDKISECQPFGKPTWGDANDKRVVVTGGEIDAMSVAQASSFKFPCVSGHAGEGATAAMLKANYKWFDRFTEIILWLDDDEAGRAAMAECAPLFAIGKVKLAKVIPGFKDANEALQAGKYAEIELSVYAATLWVPRGIVNAADTKSDLKNRGKGTKFWRIPFPGLQEMTGGLMRAATSFWVAGTGIGKTTALQETLVDIKMHPEHSTEEPAHIGYLGFEDLRLTVQLDLMSILARQRLKINPLPEAEEEALHDTLFGDRMFELFDVENAEWSFKAITSYIRYMVKALGVNIVVLDPLTFLVAMLDGNEDERKALDKVSQQLAALSKELNVHIAVTHHLTRPSEGPGHEEGGRISLKQVRGSGGVANFASLVVGAERNQQHDNPEARTLTTWRVLKNRQLSVTGVAAYTQYELDTGRTYEIPAEQAMKLLGGKVADNKDSQFHEWGDDKGSDF